MNTERQSGFRIMSHTLTDDGVFPNNAQLPLQLIRPLRLFDSSADAFENLFRRNDWIPAWRSGIFGLHHYHSSAHEVLGCFQGSAALQFGGETGVRLEVGVGDTVIIPAGVAHKCLESDQFCCVGAYPVGQSWDTCYGNPEERPAADARISALSRWDNNPVGL